MTRDTILVGNPSIPHFGPAPVGGSTRAVVIVFFSGKRTEYVGGCKTTTGPDPYNVHGQFQLHNNLCGKYGSHSQEVSRNIVCTALSEGLHMYKQLPVRYLHEGSINYKTEMQLIYDQLQVRDNCVRTPLQPEMFTAPKPYNTALPMNAQTKEGGIAASDRAARVGVRCNAQRSQDEADCVMIMPGDAVLLRTNELEIPSPEEDRAGFVAKISEIEKNLCLSFSMCVDATWYHSIVLGTVHHFLQLDGFYCRPNSIRSEGPWYANTYIDTINTPKTPVENIKTCHDILWNVIHLFTKPDESHDNGTALKKWIEGGDRPVSSEMAQDIIKKLDDAGIRVTGKAVKAEAGKKDPWSREARNAKSIQTKVSNVVYCAVGSQIYDAALDTKHAIMDWFIVRQVQRDIAKKKLHLLQKDMVLPYFKERLRVRQAGREWRQKWWVLDTGEEWVPPVSVMSTLMGTNNFVNKAQQHDIIEWQHLDAKTAHRDSSTRKRMEEIEAQWKDSE